MRTATNGTRLSDARQWIGCPVDAADGRVGQVIDVYFDDWTWTVRHVVIDTGRWLPGRTVLVIPEAFHQVARQPTAFHVMGTAERIRRSPHVDTAKPVSRQMEDTLRAYYQWSRDRTHAGPFFPDTEDLEPALPQTHEARERALRESVREASDDEGDRHLRSLREVMGYTIQARDDDAGRVKGLIVDVDTWSVRYLVVAPHTWWPANKVLIPIEPIRGLSWQEGAVLVDLSREQIKHGSAYDLRALMNQEGSCKS